MGESVLVAVQAMMLSPWLYALIVALAMLDAFFPLVPSEMAVLLAGTYAAVHGPNLALVIASGAVGAFIGDHIAYGVARGLGARVLARARPGSRAARAHAWAREATERRGGPVLIGARFVPGGRTAMTMTMGATRFPVRRFAAFDAIACLVWATYTSGVGYLGGHVFAEQPLVGVLVGTVVALTAGVGFELLARRRSAATVRRSDPAPGSAPAGPTTETS